MLKLKVNASCLVAYDLVVRKVRHIIKIRAFFIANCDFDVVPGSLHADLTAKLVVWVGTNWSSRTAEPLAVAVLVLVYLLRNTSKVS